MSSYIDPELERAVIGCALSSARARIDLLDVRPGHFADLRHAALWRLIGEMDSRGEAIDVLTVIGAMRSPRISTLALLQQNQHNNA